MTPYYPTLPDGTKVCKRGHKYDCTLRTCPDCLAATSSVWFEKNRERIHGYWKEYDAKRAGTPARKWKEPELSRQKRLKRYLENKEEVRRKAAEYYKRKPERNIWYGMIRRCTDPKALSFKHYGGRGITVCDRWTGENGFEKFMIDIGPRPSADYSIERNDSNGNYEPKNCRWATRDEQARNRRSNRIIEWNGKRQCIEDWARELGVSVGAIAARLGPLNWSIERALTTRKSSSGYEKALFVEP